MEEEEPKSMKTIPLSNQKTYKNKTDPRFAIDQELFYSNSESKLLDIKENKEKEKLTNVKKKKHPYLQRTISAKSYFDHYDLNNCEYCRGIDNILKKDKSKLSSFIEDNPLFLRLFGNPRYNKSSPFLFVEDHKNKIDDDRIGLLPIPSKPKLTMKSKDENNRLYEIQRKVVMMRRFQYGKKFNDEVNLNNDENSQFFENIRKIQQWWKFMYKIIYIQKIFRGFRIRKRVNFIIYFINIINTLQKLLDNIKARRVLRTLMNIGVKLKILPSKNNMKGYYYISKTRRKRKNIVNLNNYGVIKKNNNNYQKFINGKKEKNNNDEMTPKYNNYKNKKNEDDDNIKNNDSYSNYNSNHNSNYNSNNRNNNKNDDIYNMKNNSLKNKNIPKDKIKNNLSLLTK